MNKDQKNLAENYQSVMEANPMQQQMRGQLQQYIQNQWNKELGTNPAAPRQKTGNEPFDSNTGLPLTPEGEKRFQQSNTPQQQQQRLQAAGFNSLQAWKSSPQYAAAKNPSQTTQQTPQTQQSQAQQAQQTQPTPNQQPAQNTQQIQQGMAELGKQLTQFQQKFNEIMKSLGNA
jgi:hypothetical protein